MDMSGCPPGYATDNLIIRHPDQPCVVPIVAFIVPIVIFILVKIFVLRRVWVFWYHRRAEMRNNRAFANRHPVVPILLTIIAVLYAADLILWSTNVFSAVNGWGMLVYILSTLIWAGYCLLHVKKYIGLGRRLIPLAMAHGPPPSAMSTTTVAATEEHSSTAQSSPRSAESSLSVLNTFDGMLQLLVGLMVLSITASTIIALIPGLIHPEDEVWARVSFILVGLFAFFLYISLLYHLERLIRATKLIFEEATPGRSNATTVIKLRHAIKIMRTSQTVWFLLGNATFLLFLLGGLGVIDMGWILLLCTMLIETTASAFAYFATKSRARDHSSSSKGKHAAGNGDATKGTTLTTFRQKPSGTKDTGGNTFSPSVGAGTVAVFVQSEA